MKIHQQFDLNLRVLRPERLNDIPRVINELPILVEKLTRSLLEQGYIVIESSSKYMGIPKTITVIKDFTGPFTTIFSSKINDDFKSFSRKLGMEKFFE